jgi:hypothetical protein
VFASENFVDPTVGKDFSLPPTPTPITDIEQAIEVMHHHKNQDEVFALA